MLNSLAKKHSTAKADPATVARLYKTVTDLARAPVFYTRFAVPDTTDGRYDLLCVMLGLFLFRVQLEDGVLAQALFDHAFKDVERGLREAGVGDLGVPKHMKRMLAAFYGRVAAYYEALEQQETEGLAITLTRNLYNGDAAAPARAMGEWIAITWQFLRATDAKEFIQDPDLILELVPPEEA
jgi:cytochrome b pre-mRNA-processing protein 3